VDLASDFEALPYPQYAGGLLAAAGYARRFGITEFSAIEFGVAGGNGLLHLSEYARRLSRELKLHISVFGFDTTTGLPEPQDWRDMPWGYRPADFPCNVEALTARLNGSAELVIGDIAETFPRWFSEHHPPLGFASIDVDYYSSARAILEPILSSTSSHLLPVSSFYLDDINAPAIPDHAGEYAAILEFNRATDRFHFSPAVWIKANRAYPEKLWLTKMFDLYAMDHPSLRSERTVVAHLDLR
jgi:hypothetical protein